MEGEGYPSARCRNAAICPRVTLASGQNMSLIGVLHPRVTPAVVSLSMAASKMLPSSSVKYLSANDGGNPWAKAVQLRRDCCTWLVAFAERGGWRPRNCPNEEVPRLGYGERLTNLFQE